MILIESLVSKEAQVTRKSKKHIVHLAESIILMPTLTILIRLRLRSASKKSRLHTIRLWMKDKTEAIQADTAMATAIAAIQVALAMKVPIQVTLL